jgi:hypothetical protein
MKHARAVGVVLATAAAALVFWSWAQGQQIHRDGFEARETAWIKGTADAPFRELVHEITDTTSHDGQRSERLQITSEQGNYIYYVYPTKRAPLTEELNVSLWLKANRYGVQLLGRLVLPKERNPSNLDEPLTTLVRGDLYQSVSRWQRLELRRPTKLAKQQQALMRTQLMRDVDFTDAYIDQIVLNVYAGPGLAEVWIDDLEIGPVVETPASPAPGHTTGAVKLQPPVDPARAANRNALVEMDHDQLLVNRTRFFIRGIRHSDTPLKVLRDAGFNTVWFDHASSPALLEEAVNLGFWLVPALPTRDRDTHLVSADGLRQEISRFIERDAVLFWDIGGGLTKEQVPEVLQMREFVRSVDPQRPVGADAWDGFRSYSRNLDLQGVHRWPLGTGLELSRYREWLTQRRQLGRLGAFTWTWVQTHLPDWYSVLVYERPGSVGYDEPIGPQPEQIRLLTYVALAAGCRGLGFWSDRFLADSHQGRDRLLSLALLNQELRMLEPLLLSAEDPSWINTSDSDVKAAVFRTARGVLVLPIWVGKGAQYVPGQAAVAKLTIDVPSVPINWQAWAVSPADVRTLRTERVVGGTRVTVPEFSLTAAIFLTADNNDPNGMVVRFQNLLPHTRKMAAQWAYYLADVEIRKVAQVQAELERTGHPLPDGQKLLENAQQRLGVCVQHWNSGDYREAYAEAERALRPLRILMRAQWQLATASSELTTPVASPYAVSFYTLPRHWRFMEQIRQGNPGANVLPNGDFEIRPDQTAESWVRQETTLDDVEMEARRVTDEPHEGRQCLKLLIKPKDPKQPPPAALERTFLAINSPVIRFPPGTLVQVSGWVRIPNPIVASADGALFYDSAGGEPLAVRLTEATKWKQFVLYRRVPASGEISVTLALTGLGLVYFDDIRIQPLLGNGPAGRAYQAQR